MKSAEPRWKIEARILMKTIKGMDAFEIEDAEGFCHASEERVRVEQREVCHRAWLDNTSYHEQSMCASEAILNAGKEGE